MKTIRGSARGLCVLALLTASFARAGEHPFPLTAGLPADSVLVITSRHNPERAFLDKAWGEVFAALHSSGIFEDLWNLASGEMTPEQKAEADKITGTVKSLIAGVDWSAMRGSEMAIAMRLVATPQTLAPEFIMLGRMKPETATANFKGLRAILAEIKGRAGEAVTLADAKQGDAMIASLRPAGGGPPIALSVACRKDVVLITLGGALLEDSLGLLSGESPKKSIAEASRFKKAFDGLPAAEDGLVFFDARRTMETIGGALNGFTKQMQAAVQQSEQAEKDAPPADSEGGSGDAEDGKPAARGGQAAELKGALAWMGVASQLINDVNVIDFVAATIHTDEKRVFTDTRVVLRGDAREHAAYALMTADARIDPFDRFIPQDALSFSVSGGIPWQAAYAYIKGFARTHVPDGPALVDMVQGRLRGMGFDIEKDFLAWIDGPMIQIELKGGNPMSPVETVSLLRVKDEKLARQKVEGALDHVGQLLGGMGGPMGGGKGESDQPIIVSTPVKIAGKSGFYQIRFNHPMLMMVAAQFSPVWGVAEGHLWLGMSKKSLQACLETAAGDAPSIRKSPRFLAEGLMPSTGAGELTSISYTDQTRTAESIGELLGAVGMVGMMASMNPQLGQSPAGKILGAVTALAAKAGPAVEKLNFFLSSAECTTFDGKAWTTRQVQNYRDPPMPARASDSTGDKKDGNEDDWGDDWGDDDKGNSKAGGKDNADKPAKP